MVLLEIDVQRIRRFKFESDPPEATDGNCPTLGIAVQPMEVPARHVHVFCSFGCVQRVQNSQTASLLIGPYARTAARFE